MYVNKCKYCKKFIVRGFKNEFHEHFCTENCYIKYCKSNEFEPNIEKLEPFDIWG